jgi:3-phosphoshikimate 1-carboxyvinyltransferase
MSSPLRPARARLSTGLTGSVQAPANKSISHRAIILGGTAIGETRITGLLESADVMATIAAMRALGAEIEPDGEGWVAAGRGVGGLVSPSHPLDLGNSGTSARLLLGLMATNPIRATLYGDASLSKRPMDRVMRPLEAMGARFTSRSGYLPINLEGSTDPLPIETRLPVASAQLKSAILLAGLNTPGITSVIETTATRDYSERMLQAFGAELSKEKLENQASRISISGYPDLRGQNIAVSGDPSSAAFMLVAGLLAEESRVVVENVGLNPTRTGLFVTLEEMGASLAYENSRHVGGQEVADIVASASTLHGVTVPANRAASMIDEYPVLAVAAAVAEGITRFEGIAELRVKESDRLAATAAMLQAANVTVRSGADWMEIEGRGGRVTGGERPVQTHLDHRLAMSALLLGLVAERGLTVDDVNCIQTSFPDFIPLMQSLGAEIEPN